MPRCGLNTVQSEMRFTAALGLGGNIGDPPAAMGFALRQLDQHPDCRVLAVSRLYKTPPWGKTDQADFFNCCALIRTALAPEALLDLCLDIERDMKRERVERWGPRTIDIDILTYGKLAQETERLQLPHPRMTERAFVLMPLSEIAPDLMVGDQTVAEWLDKADQAGIRLARENRDWWRET
ncbi:MAG: 2-amino-4-hydroxy-6-hydroxymethyldihydropteridine diphosphokinase [Alphaproteobacteria bacterium]|jgi:2-amino-4-hydroxy-6-hydroxymethyldihydropteridine diphosphokinase|nr:2-amino-4-hydroxy-6-hydroxymethyldihydropteridine diphosphokinase [Alphaproteobacteria bacterium]MBU1550943.1 2-amino-4-hydroxy-6-hydroxymethyldihydropteridine diphosphokinase [Alphaproteobacteria bacterium]MBU2339079.1 2-amino-4-hydroxy-6-hydroxymethyldihydropteridine diphosphokinase [Alphaproteobacteria bacterium]MBU2387170.1 2-amino-4-hydroxy-6-hydroxymethyldihydropteridine diphosphokinase [Alphaproteobacteria bacterium]